MWIKRSVTRRLFSSPPFFARQTEEGSIIYVLAPVMLAIIFKIVVVAALTASP